MNEIKNLQNSVLNQMKYNSDVAKDMYNNPLQFNKGLSRQNPTNSMLSTWYIAQARKTFVHFCTLPFVISEEFWRVWLEVYSSTEQAPKRNPNNI